MSNNRSTTNTVARAIQERLAQAQQQPATASATEGSPGTLRVTKDGRLLGPDEPTPADTQVTSIPSATFHSGAPTMGLIVVARRAMTEFLRTAEADEREHGGAFFGPTEEVITDFVPVPETAARTRASVTFDGPYFERALGELRARSSGIGFQAFGHAHLGGLRDLSAGDHAQLNALHAAGGLPPAGLLVLLAVRSEGCRTIVRAWKSKAANVLEEVALVEVDDPTVSLSGSRTPQVPRHALASDAGAERFARELAELEARRFSATATVEERGVAVVVAHPDRAGRLKIDVAAEGWDRLPRVSTLDDGGAAVPVVGALAPLGSVWSSAWSLVDLLEFVVERRVWRRLVHAQVTATEQAAVAT